MCLEINCLVSLGAKTDFGGGGGKDLFSNDTLGGRRRKIFSSLRKGVKNFSHKYFLHTNSQLCLGSSVQYFI